MAEAGQRAQMGVLVTWLGIVIGGPGSVAGYHYLHGDGAEVVARPEYAEFQRQWRRHEQESKDGFERIRLLEMRVSANEEWRKSVDEKLTAIARDVHEIADAMPRKGWR